MSIKDNVKYNINPLALTSQCYLLARAGFIIPPLSAIFFAAKKLLPEPVTNIINIEIDTNTTDTSGYLYITMKNHFLVIDLATKTIKDMYTYTQEGRSLEKLDYEGIEKSDIN